MPSINLAAFAKGRKQPAPMMAQSGPAASVVTTQFGASTFLPGTIPGVTPLLTLEQSGNGRIVLSDGTVIDGITGEIIPPKSASLGCSTCGPAAPAPFSLSPVAETATAGIIDINPTLKIDGTFVALGALAVWYFFFRK